METESGAKIAIRGKGSVKEGKGRSDAAHASNQEEDLHCLIMADTEDKVNKAKKLIHNVIETVSLPCPVQPRRNLLTFQAASIPEGQNELKRNQLRELAALNGTLRDDENQACQNCGQIGHRKYDCPEKQNFTASIICRVCGNAGHMARDCPDRQRGASWRNDGPGPRPAGRIGGGGEDDAEYEVSHHLQFRTNSHATDIYEFFCSNSWLSSAAEQHQPALRPDLDPTATGTPNRGNVDLQADLPLGGLATTIATTTMVEAVGAVEVEVEAARVALHPGLGTDVSETMTTREVIPTTAVRTMAMARPRPAQRLGSKLPVLKPGTVALLPPEQRRGSRLLARHPLTVVILEAMARLQASGHRLHRLLRLLTTSRR